MGVNALLRQFNLKMQWVTNFVNRVRAYIGWTCSSPRLNIEGIPPMWDDTCGGFWTTVHHRRFCWGSHCRRVSKTCARLLLACHKMKIVIVEWGLIMRRIMMRCDRWSRPWRSRKRGRRKRQGLHFRSFVAERKSRLPFVRVWSV